jgi:hypothetical protein
VTAVPFETTIPGPGARSHALVLGGVLVVAFPSCALAGIPESNTHASPKPAKRQKFSFVVTHVMVLFE